MGKKSQWVDPCEDCTLMDVGDDTEIAMCEGHVYKGDRCHVKDAFRIGELEDQLERLSDIVKRLGTQCSQQERAVEVGVDAAIICKLKAAEEGRARIVELEAEVKGLLVKPEAVLKLIEEEEWDSDFREILITELKR